MMKESNMVTLEQVHNTLHVYCPSVKCLADMKEFLTFTRAVTERKRGKMLTTYVREPCYKPNGGGPFILDCPAGFLYMILERFETEYAFNVLPKELHPDVVKNTQPDWSQIGDDVEWRTTQKETLEKMIATDRGRIIVPTATGKSFMISQYARLMPKARIVVGTYSNSVLGQLYENLCKLLPRNQVGIHCATTKENTDARVVCCSTGTLRKYFPPGKEQYRDVYCADELHEFGSAKRLEVLEGIKHAKMFGFSANEERPDGAEFRINGLFGPVIAKLEYQAAVDHKLVTPIHVIWVPVDSNRDPASFYTDITAKERHGLWRFGVRNQAIADAARLFDDNEQVLITTDKIDHALHIRKLLPEFTVVYSPQDFESSAMQWYASMGLLDGIPPMTVERLKMLKSMFEHNKLKKVIATGVWSRGVDFPQLSVIIRADAKNSCIADTQWPGRASRRHENKTISLLFDFTDEYNPNFRKKAAARYKRYEEKQWRQITLQELLHLMGQ